MKIVTSIVWLLIIVNYFMPLVGEYSYLLNWLGAILLIAHLVEFIVFKEKVKAKGDSPGMGFMMTMVFGIFYWGK